MNDGVQVPDRAKCCLPAPVWRDTARDRRLPAKITCKSSHQIVFQSLRHFEYKSNSGQVVKSPSEKVMFLPSALGSGLIKGIPIEVWM